MNNFDMKRFYITHSILALFLLVSCGSSDNSDNEKTIYKKENIVENKLELSIEASGSVNPKHPIISPLANEGKNNSF